jgi:Fe-S-cluster containining protein
VEHSGAKLSEPLNTHPCLSCGACCAYYRVSFHPSETSPESFETPNAMVIPVHSEESVMMGTHTIQNTRCVALTGEVGKDAHCSIYENRPSPCRKFEASYSYGVKEPRCDEARVAHGLLPLTLRDYDGFRNRT